MLPSPQDLAHKTTFNWTVSIANVVALLAVVVSLITLALSARKDRILRKMQYADQIRNAAALLTAKLERWSELAFSVFEDLQAAITDADIAAVNNLGTIVIRDRFWRDLGLARIGISNKIADEQIHIAYATLYGYDAGVRELFLATIDRLKQTADDMYRDLAYYTQKEILLFGQRNPASGVLGNKLREVCSILAARYAQDLLGVLKPFRDQMVKIMEADDDSVARRAIRVESPKQLFPPRTPPSEDLSLKNLPLDARHVGDWPMFLTGITFHEWSRPDSKKTSSPAD